MSDEEFEDKLRSLTAKLARPDLTGAWKAEILARARTDPRSRFPRWPMLALGMTWVCIAILRLTTPEASILHGAGGGAEVRAAVPPDFRDTLDTPLRALIALHSNSQFLDHP
jgi:hypothetical protein